MESSVRHCIINVGVGGWYAKGTERLEKSLNYVGFHGDVLTWKDCYPSGSPTHEESPYSFKVFAFFEAINRGYSHILWLDCSVWALQNPDKLFDIIDSDGYYLSMSGYSAGQVNNDRSLYVAGVGRDEAMNIPDCATGIIGLNINNPTAKSFLYTWSTYERMGAFKGSRTHNPAESSDPRFLFHRQDQAAASLAAYKSGMKLHEPNIYTCYFQPQMPESIIFTMRGM